MTAVKYLSNGMRAVLEPMPYLRTAAVGIYVQVGSVNESKEQNGLSHLIEHMLFQGTEKRSAEEISRELAFIGDDVNAYTSKEHTCIYGTTITEHLQTMLELFSDMLFHSEFKEKELRKEKKIILDEIDMYEDTPEDLVHDLIQKEVWKNNSIGFDISGSKRQVKSFQRETVVQFWKKHYCPEKMVISIAGAFCEAEMFEFLEKLFSEENLQPLSVAGVSQEEAPSYRSCFCTRDKEIEQLHMNLAFPCITLGSDLKYLFSIANSMLGGSNHSVLFQEIRERLGLAYSVYSYGSAYAASGLWHIDVTVNPAQSLKAFHAVEALIKKFLLTGINEAVLHTHLAQMRTELIMGSENAKARMSSNAQNVFLYGRTIPLEEKLLRLSQITLNEVKEFAAEYLCLEKLSVCLVGEKEAADFKALKKSYDRR